jgi:hypothetical protein
MSSVAKIYSLCPNWTSKSEEKKSPIPRCPYIVDGTNGGDVTASLTTSTLMITSSDPGMLDVNWGNAMLGGNKPGEAEIRMFIGGSDRHCESLRPRGAVADLFHVFWLRAAYKVPMPL